MKIIIIDPGLKNINGHNFATNFSLAKELKKKGINVEILCHKNVDQSIIKYFFDADIKIKNVFEISSYSGFPYQNRKNFFESLKLTTQELDKYIESTSHADIAIWPPCVFPLQLISNLTVKVAKVQFIFLEPAFSSFSNQTIQIYSSFRQKFIERKDINYLCVEERIKNYFVKFLPIDIEICPFLTFSRFVELKKNKLEKIGVFGFEKIINEKFAISFLDLLKSFNILFDFHDPRKYFHIKKGFDNKLGDLRKKLNSEKFTFSNFKRDLNKKISEYDCILYFFNPLFYQLIPSGIVSESIATGRPIILPRQNSPADTVNYYNCGLFFEWNDVKSLQNNIQYSIDNFKQLKKNSFNASNLWSRKQGIDNFLKFIFKKIK